MSQIAGENQGGRYWRSLEDLNDSPAFRRFMEQEFPASALEAMGSATRRQFLKLMGASAVLAGFAGCGSPQEKILPYAHRPEDRTPGMPVRYATALELAGVATGLLVTSYDGRPIKVEGNPRHPGSLGATSAVTQTSVLELYDPDRSKSVIRRDGGETRAADWAAFDAVAAELSTRFRARRGEGLRVLSEASASPTLLDLRLRFHRLYPAARWAEYEPLSRDNERAGALLAFGKPFRTHLALERASVIVCLDADILFSHPDAVRHARMFAAGRRAENGKMSRLYVAESVFSLTGGMADHRFPMRSGEVIAFARDLAAALFEEGLEIPVPVGIRSALAPASEGRQFSFARAVARDLLRHRGETIVTAGSRQPAEVHALCHLLNEALGNLGRTVTMTPDADPERPAHVEAIRSLTHEMRSGRVEMLLILGGNPVFDAPVDLAFDEALRSVETSIHLSLYENETSRAATWHLPRAHPLESWGDVRAYDGTISIVQPLIAPLYDGRTSVELLASLVDAPSVKGHDLVRETFMSVRDDEVTEAAWERALHDGVVAGSGFRTEVPRAQMDAITAAIGKTTMPRQEAGLEIVFRQDAGLFDGRFANNGWLQELPDPMTKVTWDNPVLLSPADAAELGLLSRDLVVLEHDGRTLEAAVYVMPGQAQGSVTISVGYGRRAAGGIGDGVGFDAYQLRASARMGFARGLQIRPTGRRTALATTQDHFAIDRVGLAERGRRLGELYREADLETYRAHPEFAKHAGTHPPLASLWSEHTYEGHRWGMAIDLSACVGCGACVVACQAENNIPIVGKEQVDRGREMHWIRVDRYFSGEPDSPKVVHQPVACHHCENAPCEQVCPVAATVHDRDGLNVMVYNRCIGTRYCSNNCPYKVRRFNFFNYNGKKPETLKMVSNPDVTLRARGVMEKCTFCVQRISAVKIAAKNARRSIADGEITPACAQACPAGAIVFGDLNDPASQVSRLQAADRSYAMLAGLNIKPRTWYLAKLRNPSADLREMEGGAEHAARG